MTFRIPKTAVAALERNPARPRWAKNVNTDISKTDEIIEQMENDTKRQRRYRRYFGMIKCVDDNVGKMLRHLKKTGLDENTVVVFTSDHGSMMGEHGNGKVALNFVTNSYFFSLKMSVALNCIINEIP